MKFAYFAVLLCFFPAIFALPSIEVVPPKPEIREELSAYAPGRAHAISTEPEVVMPSMRSFAQFGGIELELGKKVARPWCGPSPETNTLNCFDFNKGGAYLQSFPIPGKLSSTPLFYDNSWLMGTAKGFLMRVEANEDNRKLPKLNGEILNLWGSNSRNVMAGFRPKPIYVEGFSAEPAVASQYTPPTIPKGVKWIFSASSGFIGNPVIKNGLVYIYASSQYFQAFNWETGKLIWAVRLAPAGNLRLNSDALTVTDTEVFVGNSLGTLLSLNPADGAVLWTWQVPSADDSQRLKTSLPAGPDKFYGIVASPLVSGSSLIVSNVESMTQAISLNSHELIWSYPAGSVAKAREYKNNILLGTSNGKVVSLNKDNGLVNWSANVTDTSPIVSLFLTKNNVLLAATRSGQIFMLNLESGKVLAHNFPIGDVNGEFFTGYNKAEACLSFAFNGFRCFRAKL
ncbi:MAG: PQQ-binding-like beta-propeller repeat protein [Bdellovibrionota bacterium]